MQKKTYNSAFIDIVTLRRADVICTSGDRVAKVYTTDRAVTGGHVLAPEREFDEYYDY